MIWTSGFTSEKSDVAADSTRKSLCDHQAKAKSFFGAGERDVLAGKWFEKL